MGRSEVHARRAGLLGRGSVFAGEAFKGESVGLEVVDDEHWEVRRGSMPLGVPNDRPRTVMPVEVDA